MATKKKTTPKKAIRKPSRPAKKPARKTPSRKLAKPAARKKTAGKTPAKKTAKRPPARKAASRKPARPAPAAKKPPRKIVKPAPPKKSGAGRLPPPPPAPVARIPVHKVKPPRSFRKDELQFFRAQLQKQLDLTQGNLNALAGDNLKRSPIESSGDISAHSTHMADQGTDNFDRELALNLASSRQDSLYDIEDAIRRIDEGNYGVCEACGGAIERPRLKALPFAKKCMACQNAAERGRTKYRPFGGTLPLQQQAAEDASDSPDAMG